MLIFGGFSVFAADHMDMPNWTAKNGTNVGSTKDAVLLLRDYSAISEEESAVPTPTRARCKTVPPAGRKFFCMVLIAVETAVRCSSFLVERDG